MLQFRCAFKLKLTDWLTDTFQSLQSLQSFQSLQSLHSLHSLYTLYSLYSFAVSTAFTSEPSTFLGRFSNIFYFELQLWEALWSQRLERLHLIPRRRKGKTTVVERFIFCILCKRPRWFYNSPQSNIKSVLRTHGGSFMVSSTFLENKFYQQENSARVSGAGVFCAREHRE